jgi:AcrR family transcriptional regulator
VAQSPGEWTTYLAELPEGAQVLVAAARSLLLEDGFSALSLDNIAARAGKNKSMVRHYFGGKEGLMAALVDDLIHEAVQALVEHTACLPEGQERIRVYLGESRSLIDKPEFRGFFDILPHALRDERLRAKIASLYDWYRAQNAHCLRMNGGSSDPSVQALASLVIASVDGLAIQAALDPEGFDPEPVLALLESLVRDVTSNGHPR